MSDVVFELQWNRDNKLGPIKPRLIESFALSATLQEFLDERDIQLKETHKKQQTKGYVDRLIVILGLTDENNLQQFEETMSRTDIYDYMRYRADPIMCKLYQHVHTCIFPL